MFFPAVKDEDGNYGYSSSKQENISQSMCRKKYGAIPREGEAWLVEEGRIYINWTRVDEDMYLLDNQGNVVEED